MRQKRRCIKLLLLDAHGTIFTGKDRKWQNLVAYVVREETGHALDADLLHQRTKQVRIECAREMSDLQNTEAWWAEVNQRVLAMFRKTISAEEGRRIHRRIVEGVDLYVVQPARKKFVDRLVRKFSGRGVIRAIATNAPEAAIDSLLSEYRLKYAVQRIYGPTAMGGLRKPARAFFDEVLRRQGVRPEETLLVANSLLNDLPAAGCGIHVCVVPQRIEIFHPKDLRPYMSAPGVLVHATHTVANAWGWIDRHFVAAP
jgi:FMN phosphatase YigB (HAD superfamily)